ncbi:MAG: nucleotidyltransferase domain-containing protein [Bacteroidales bacterium]|nr:nucleotidyltransferase domain-containing protein [Bacteroidales bacterium]
MVRNEHEYHEKIGKLKEREKELKCLYRVEEIINNNLPVDEFLMEIVKHIWGGWQYPIITRVKITFENRIYKESGWDETEWVQQADIVIDENVLGKIEVYYTKFKRLVVDSQFLPQEQKLLNTIATRISNYIFRVRLAKTIEILEAEKNQNEEKENNSLPILTSQSDTHWIWRNEMTNKIAGKLNLEKFGVKAVYLIGSTKNATAGPASDIDLLVHFEGDTNQRANLQAWIEGWSLCLSEMNFLKTGYKTDGIIDLHLVSDEDINNKTSYAIMIGAVTDGAKLIKGVENN